MPVEQSLVGREFPATAPFEVTEARVTSFAEALGTTYDGQIAPTFPIVLAFDAMSAFLAAEQIDLFRIIHGEQRFVYQRPIRIGDRLSAALTVASLRQIGGADIIGTSSAIVDDSGSLVCTAKATLVHTAGDA